MFKINNIDCKITTKFRSLDVSAVDNFISSLNSKDFNDGFNVNLDFEKFYCKIFDMYNQSFPIKTKTVKSKNLNAPWMTKTLKRCIRKKYSLYNLLRRGLIRKKQFNSYKNILAYVIKKVKNLYYLNKFKKSEDCSKLWMNINTLLKRNNNNKSCIKISDNDGNDVEIGAIPNYFNDYFSSIASTLDKECQLKLTGGILGQLILHLIYAFSTPLTVMKY